MRAYYNENDPATAAWLRQLIKNGDITEGYVDDRSITEVKPSDLAGYDRCHFFAGIGTWDYVLNQSGWGDKPVWTASLPCQSFSTAGKRHGVKDERHLLPVYLELVRRCKPEIQFGEQVASSEVVGTQQEAAFIVAVQGGDYAKANKLAKKLVSKNGFAATRRWVDDLRAVMEAEGYAIGLGVLGAHSSGAAHIRQRLYWSAKRVADSTGERRGEARAGSVRPKGWESRHSGMADAIDQRSQRRIQGRQNAERQTIDGCTGRSGADSEIPRHFKIEWLYCRDNKYRPIEPGIKPLVDVTAGELVRGCDTSEAINANATQEAGAMRLKGYGNAIQVDTAIAFIRHFMVS